MTVDIEAMVEDERVELEREREEIEETKRFLLYIAEEKGIDIRPSLLHLE